MKRVLFVLLLFATIGITAREKRDDTKYLSGAVPEVNGIVTFTKSFTVKGKTEAEVQRTMHRFVNKLVENSITAPGNYARMMEDKPGSTVARVCEWLVFTKKALNLDRARFRYTIDVKTVGERVSITINGLSYYYNEDMETHNGIILKAEEWISDREALNKAKTKLYPKSGKFRRKTVDRMNELFNAAMDAFETQEAEPVTPTRRSVVEE